MASTIVVRSLAGSCAQTCRLTTFCMAGPPGCGYSLEGCHQFRNSCRGQDCGFAARLGGEVGAADGNVGELIREKFDLAMAKVSWQIGEAG
jgi:hypothetical protein